MTAVLAALDALHASQPADLTYPEVQRHYGLASEALEYVVAAHSDCERDRELR